MKKIAIFALAAMALVSCGGHKAKTIELANMEDSLNYCMGYVNGYQLKHAALAEDSSEEAINELIDALEFAYSHTLTETTGQQLGQMANTFAEEGINKNPLLVYNGEIYLQGFVNAYLKDTTTMKENELMPFLMRASQEEAPEGVKYEMKKADCPKEAKKVELTCYMDSVNYAFGAYTGMQVSSFLSEADTITDDIFATLVKYINKGLKLKVINGDAYTYGLQIGEAIHAQEDMGLGGAKEVATKFDIIKQGIINGLYGYEDMMTVDEANEYLQTSFQAMQEKKVRDENAEWISEQEKFLSDNQKAEGVQVTASGLQYKVLQEGKGDKPAAEDTVEVKYVGRLINDTIFDDSSNHGGTVKFALNQVIPGWTEGIQLMNAGAHFMFYIPENLAYGAQAPYGSPIKPFSALIFDVELVRVIKAVAKPADVEMPSIQMSEVE